MRRIIIIFIIIDKSCKFKIDTSSDVLIVNERLIKESKQRILVENSFFKYPTEEKVSIKFKVKVKIGLGAYFDKM